MIETTKAIGNVGERVATELLTSVGYAIVERNARIGNVEVDIVARHANRLVIVEVKTRRDDHLDDRFGLDAAKLRRLARAGSTYVRMHNLPLEVQIDAVLITNHFNAPPTVEHIPDILLPPFRRR
jgi:putative endonuclease